MKFGNFLFPTVDDPELDGRFIEETVAEARLSDELGMDAVWLAEHHFDGMCAYVDPVSFAAALAVATDRITIGFAIAQMALHHPVRMAEQVAMIDQLSRGRLIVGIGRGPSTNSYEYEGYDLAPDEAQSRLEEAEEVMLKAWTTENLEHEGRFWTFRLPMLRPRPFTLPHPPVIRACSSDGSMVAQAKAGRPFLMNIQSLADTQRRMDLYRETMREAGYDDAAIAANCGDVWVWRNIFVGETDEEAAAIGVPAFQRQSELRDAMRNRMFAERGMTIPGVTPGSVAGLPRRQVEHALIHGSPDTVAEKMAEIEATGAGGVIASFRIGPMDPSVAERSLRLFMSEVAPRFKG